MEPNLKTQLLENTVVEKPHFDASEESTLEFGLPMWLVFLIALICLILGIRVLKGKDKSGNETSGEKSTK